MPEITVEQAAVIEDGTFIKIEGDHGNYTDVFHGRQDAKTWAIDVLVAYYDFSYADAKRMVDEAGCDCDGPTHSRHCWWVTAHDDGRDQDV